MTGAKLDGGTSITRSCPAVLSYTKIGVVRLEPGDSAADLPGFRGPLACNEFARNLRRRRRSVRTGSAHYFRPCRSAAGSKGYHWDAL